MTTTKSLSINAVVARYQELGHNGAIKLFFRKNELKKHTSENSKAFFTVRPILVKVGNWFDDHINFTFVIKNKYAYLMENKDCDIWCLEIDSEAKIYKPSDRCADSWWNRTILKSNKFEAVLSYSHCSVYGYAGDYVDVDQLLFYIGLMKSVSAYKLFTFDLNWDQGYGGGFMYLIVVPKHNGKCIIKWGKTVNLIYRFRLYLNGVAEDLRKLGIIVLALCSIGNTSVAEDQLSKYFTEDEYCSQVEGNEYYKIDYHEDEPNYMWWNYAQDLFQIAMNDTNEKIKGNNSMVTEFYEYGTNVFRLEKDKKKYGFNDEFKSLNLE